VNGCSGAIDGTNWLNVLQVMGGRLVTFSARLDF
jgi:hypothetical protein